MPGAGRWVAEVVAGRAGKANGEAWGQATGLGDGTAAISPVGGATNGAGKLGIGLRFNGGAGAGGGLGLCWAPRMMSTGTSLSPASRDIFGPQPVSARVATAAT